MPVMDSRVNGSGVDDRGNLLAVTGVGASATYSGSYNGNGHTGGSSINASVLGSANGSTSGYTLMVAGQRTGKTSFLRLLLDTSEVSQTATQNQLNSVAKFVQGCSGHTTHIRAASIDIELDADSSGVLKPLALTLIDTPSLDFNDENASERAISEVLRQVETRLAEGIEDEWKARIGDHHVHLCIYFLDPEDIVPPSVPGPPAPLVSRTRTNSFSGHEPDPVILEPPVTTNPLLYRPTLRPAQINTIRRLSARVNVLPVVARADTLTNDRLAAIRLAVRRDLAEAGIGFGIFDTDNHAHADSSAPANGEATNGYSSHANGTSPHISTPTSPASPTFLRLPYALVSPDIYSHSDGVPRVPQTRHELIQQYTPSTHPAPPSKLVRGKFVRNYRWGSMDVLDSAHSDFLALRTAVFHHMGTLQKYTREYLFDKFRADFHLQHHHISPSHHSPHHSQQGIVSRSQLPPLPTVARPTLAIDTAPPHVSDTRHSALHVSRDVALAREVQSVPPIHSGYPDPGSSSTSARVSPSAPRSSKQRTKKITVACNFCRSRKLKCDGGRPACAQCIKRSNSCDYQPQNNKRRGTQRHRKHGDDSDSDLISGEEPSAEPSLSPEVSSYPTSRRSSNGRRPGDPYSSTVAGPSDRRDDHHMYAHMGRPPSMSMSTPGENRSLFKDNELPHIATLSLPGSEVMSAPHNNTMQGLPLPPIRPANDHQAAQRKRASTLPGRSRAASNTGPKVVACNFCRARKTRCDGQKPNCSSCERRNLPCNYNHDAPTTNLPLSRKKVRRPSVSQPGLAPGNSPPSQSPPTSSHGTYLVQAPTSAPARLDRRNGIVLEEGDIDLKRKIEGSDSIPLPKRPRTEDSPGSPANAP